MGAFTPVMQFEMLHTLLTLPPVEGWYLCQMDVKKEHIQMEELYMKQPIGFEDGIGQVCRLVKSIYGLKQAGMYGIMISTAQCWISDIHACKVFIVLTFCETKKIF